VLAQSQHRTRHVRSAAVEQVVAIHHGEHDVTQLELRDGTGHVLGLARIDRATGVAGGYSAEAATARAGVTEQHHSGGA